MTTLPQSSVLCHRSPRAKLVPVAPAVLRFSDGRQTRAELHVVSLTGGLLSLPKITDPGSHVKLMFVTQAGAVIAGVEMLRPVSWVCQPFRFLSLNGGDLRKVRATVQTFLGRNGAGDDWLDQHRAKLTLRTSQQKRFPAKIVAALTLATACLGGAIYLCGAHLR